MNTPSVEEFVFWMKAFAFISAIILLTIGFEHVSKKVEQKERDEQSRSRHIHRRTIVKPNKN